MGGPVRTGERHGAPGMVLLAAVGLCVAQAGTPAEAVDRGKQVSVTRAGDAAAIMDAVENAVWAADGQAAQKQVYVVYNTDCAFSQRFFRETRALTGKVQFRWIPVYGAEAPDVVNLRTADSVADAFADRRSPPGDATAARRRLDYNLGVQNSLNYQLRAYDNSRTFAYPTLVYRTATGVKVVAGSPANLGALPAEVLSQPGKASLSPAALAITAQPVRVVKSAHLAKWFHSQPVPAVFRAAPSAQAAPVDTLGKDMEVPVSGIVPDTGWLEIPLYGAHAPKVYVHDPVMARMALLDFRVKPEGGNWRAAGPVQVRGFPDAEAPVLETLAAGQSFRRSGVVELGGLAWDEIVLYADGTRAYAPR